MLKENIDKASCLLARDYKGFGNQGQTGVRCIEVGHAEEIKGHDTIRRVYSPNGKAPTLTTMQGGNREPKVSIGAFRGRYLVDGKRQDHKMKTQGLTTQRLEVRGDSKSNTLTTVQKDNVVVEEQIRWRALTPIECERLMTMEDNSTLHGIDDKGNQKTISKTQRYKMLGNGWVIDTIAHCLKYLEGRI
jgi:site-specific DNA-cytosine methylase